MARKKRVRVPSFLSLGLSWIPRCCAPFLSQSVIVHLLLRFRRRRRCRRHLDDDEKSPRGSHAKVPRGNAFESSVKDDDDDDAECFRLDQLSREERESDLTLGAPKAVTTSVGSTRLCSSRLQSGI